MLKVMQSLEVAYSRDLVDSDEYTRVCQRLISQKRTLFEGDFKAKVGDLRKFAADFNLLADKAIRRFDAGIPATVESLPMATGGRDAATLISVTTDLIELKDALYIDMTDIDVVLPALRKVVDGLRGVPEIGPDTPELAKLRTWLKDLSGRAAHESLDDAAKRQMSLDVQSMYDCLKRSCGRR